MLDLAPEILLTSGQQNSSSDLHYLRYGYVQMDAVLIIDQHRTLSLHFSLI